MTKRVQWLEEKIVKQESYSRRENLLLHGIPESKGEDCAELAVEALNQMPIHDLSKRTFTRVHRNPPGPYTPGRTRPIIIKFHHHQDRQCAWSNRKRLTEDFPREIQIRRQKLSRVLALTRTDPSIKSAFMVEDRLVIDGVTYTVDTLHKLPPSIRDKPTTTLTKDDITVFQSNEFPLSNLFPCVVKMQKCTYRGVEHYYGIQMAKHAMDQSVIDDINNKPEDAPMGRVEESEKGHFKVCNEGQI